MVNPVQLNKRIRKAPAHAGAFSASNTTTASKSFARNNLAVTPMDAIFWRTASRQAIAKKHFIAKIPQGGEYPQKRGNT
jgi:hypothetical protein